MRKFIWWKWVGGIGLGIALLLGAVYLILRTEHLELDRDARLSAPGDFVDLSGGAVHYQLRGPSQAPLVVLVHGFSVPLYVWEPTASALEEAGYRVLSYDLYGRGYSARPVAEYDLDLFDTQLEELLAALDIEGPFTLAGLSLGGPVATHYARTHRDQINGVILIAPEVSQVQTGEIFPLNLPLVGEYLMSAVMEPLVLPGLQTADFLHPESYPDWEARYRVQLQYRGTGRALLSTIRHLTELDPAIEYQGLRETGLPVLLVWGKEDQTISAGDIETLQDLLPDLELLVVENAGHLPHIERADLINPRIIEFLQEITR